MSKLTDYQKENSDAIQRSADVLPKVVLPEVGKTIECVIDEDSWTEVIDPNNGDKFDTLRVIYEGKPHRINMNNSIKFGIARDAQKKSLKSIKGKTLAITGQMGDWNGKQTKMYNAQIK